jgi:hypothetical protein
MREKIKIKVNQGSEDQGSVFRIRSTQEPLNHYSYERRR